MNRSSSDSTSQFMGKRFIVTGAASGIGREICFVLTELGAEVVAIDRSRAVNQHPHCIFCDLTSESSIRNMVQTLNHPIDGLVNCAGLPGSERQEDILKVNILAPMLLCDLLIPHFPRGARVINIASSAGAAWRHRIKDLRLFIESTRHENVRTWIEKTSLSGGDTYIFSKEALIFFTKIFAFRNHNKGITAISLSPGITDTPMLPDLEKSLNGNIISDLRKFHAGIDASPKLIAEITTSLLSSTSHWINGVDIIADGGAHLAIEFS